MLFLLLQKHWQVERFFKQLKRKKVEREIDKLKNHTIVCGYGRNGMQAIQKLKNYQEKFVSGRKR